MVNQELTELAYSEYPYIFSDEYPTMESLIRTVTVDVSELEHVKSLPTSVVVTRSRIAKGEPEINEQDALERVELNLKGNKSKPRYKKSIRFPSDQVITSKVLIALIPRLHTDALESIVDAAIQELDNRAGDCDLEPEYDYDVDDDHTSE